MDSEQKQGHAKRMIWTYWTARESMVLFQEDLDPGGQVVKGGEC